MAFIDKKGIVFLYRLMLGTIIVLLALALSYPLKAPIDDSMDNLNCSTSPANDFDQATCWTLDIIKPFFIGVVLFIGFLILFKLK